MGGVPRWAHRPYHIVGVSGGGKWAASGYFYSKAFCHKEKLINFAFRKKCCTTSLYNIKQWAI